MAQANQPIAIQLPGKGRNFIFYEESLVITQLRYFPYVQLGDPRASSCWWPTPLQHLPQRRAEPGVGGHGEGDRAPAGHAAQLAHGLDGVAQGPGCGSRALITEMRKDVDRLEVITERFSKIGSAP
jgi:hypothetical protein